MGNKVAYFNGIRLWENLKHWKPVPVKAGQARKTGVARRLGALNPKSPNFFYEIQVHTSVTPVDAVSDLGRQETFNLQLLQVMAGLIEASTALGYLSWCQDDTEVVTVSGAANPGSYPGAGTLSYTGAGFTPAAGQDVLLRDPDSGAGFVTRLTSGGGGNAAAIFQEEVSAGWEMILVRYYFPGVEFVTLGGWETATQAEDRHAFDVAYTFTAAAHAIYKTGYILGIT